MSSRPSDTADHRFEGASVVQLLSADPRADDAIVVELHGATVTVVADAVVAQDGDFGWSWPFDELIDVVHGREESWTILGVPDIPDFGVAIPAARVDEFRRLVDERVTGDDGATGDERWSGVDAVPTDAVPTDAAPSDAAPSDHAPFEATPDRAGDAVPADDVDGAELTVVPAPEPSPVAAAFLPPPTSPPVAPAGIVTSEAPDASSLPTAEAAVPGALAGLDARDISAWFGSHQVLDRVSLAMPAGLVTALIGPSGCGKSTFLRILNRMHEMIPSAAMAGEVVLDGHDVYDPDRKLTEARREIGMVFQKPNPFPAMSIYDNTIASLRLTGTKASTVEKDEIVERCLSKAGLWNEVKDRLRQPGGGLSGGQQQRLCIARALAIQPRVLLMDEPCSALDPTSTRRIEQTIVELASEVTIVIVTHNMQQAARVSDRCAFFLAEQGTPGIIVEHGPTDAMFGCPQDPRTDDYVNGRFG